MDRFDVDYARTPFSALPRTIDGQPVAYLDGPGGTQTPERVLDAVHDYLLHHTGDSGGFFATTEETGEVILDARMATVAGIGGAGDPSSAAPHERWRGGRMRGSS